VIDCASYADLKIVKSDFTVDVNRERFISSWQLRVLISLDKPSLFFSFLWWRCFIDRWLSICDVMNCEWVTCRLQALVLYVPSKYISLIKLVTRWRRCLMTNRDRHGRCKSCRRLRRTSNWSSSADTILLSFPHSIRRNDTRPHTTSADVRRRTSKCRSNWTRSIFASVTLGQRIYVNVRYCEQYVVKLTCTALSYVDVDSLWTGLKTAFTLTRVYDCEFACIPMAAWRSSNTLVSINVVALHRSWLLLGWVIVCWCR